MSFLLFKDVIFRKINSFQYGYARDNVRKIKLHNLSGNFAESFCESRSSKNGGLNCVALSAKQIL